MTALRHSFTHHYANNAFYHQICIAQGITPDSIKTREDLDKIPLLPDSFFKDYPAGDQFIRWLGTITTGGLPTPAVSTHPTHDEVIAAYQQLGIRIMFTSGTSGRFSFVPRNQASWNRMRYSAIRLITELGDYQYTDPIILLIPNPQLTNLTIASLFGIAYDVYNPETITVALETTAITTQFLRLQMLETVGLAEKIKAKAINRLSPLVLKHADQRIITILERLSHDQSRVNIAGPPFWLNRILDRLDQDGTQLDLPLGQILTGGGWKAEENQRLDEAILRDKTHRILGIPPERYHDVYAMSECSAIFLSCEGHYKHIPPTIHPMVLDEDLNPLDYGHPGRFAFLDPMPQTYPGFIITGDQVTMHEHCPACGLGGPVLETEVTRLPGVEGRGCAAVMADLMEDHES